MKRLVFLYDRLYSIRMNNRGKIIVYTACVLLFLLSCAKQESESVYTIREDTSLLRPNPGYVQYVKNRSMLMESNKLLNVVSSSIYSLSNQRSSAKTLRSMASVWIMINPALYVTEIGTSFFKALEYGNILEMFQDTGIEGVYASPLFGTSYLWTNESKMTSYNEDAVQLEIANDAGSSEDFMTLRTAIGNQGMVFGSSILPTNTGMGPDFWLATRGIEQYNSIYTILPIPKELWSSLPLVAQGKTLPLDSLYLEDLIKENVIPGRFLQDSLPYFEKTGWAITSEITDNNGELQRYVYRFYKTPELPLLHLHNPTQQGLRIINASIIQSIGLYGSALLGFSAKPYYGLVNEEQLEYIDIFYSPIVEHIERTIQQYGAFAFLDDSLPLSLLDTMLHNNDSVFIYDSITSPYAEYSLLTQNTVLLQEMLHQAIAYKIPFERLIHTTANEKGIPIHPESLYTKEQKHYISTKAEKAHNNILQKIQKLQKQYPFITNTTIPYTSASIAGMSLGYPLEETIQFNELQYNTMVKAHSALFFFKAMLPGIIMISAQDFAAPLPLQKTDYERTGNTWKESLVGYGGYSFQVLPYSTAINRFGIPIVKSLYPEFQTQDIVPLSFKKEATRILSLRKEHDIANTSLIGVLSTSDTSIAVILKNENNMIFIAITNFSNKHSTLNIGSSNIPKIIEALQRKNIQSYPKKNITTTLRLEPFECLLLRIQ